MKVYIHLEWNDRPTKTSKLSIPSSWETSKTVYDVIKLFVNAYNSKNEDNSIDASVIHLETQSDNNGDIIYSDKIIVDVLEDRNDYYIKSGVKVSPEQTLPNAPEVDKNGVALIRCRNYGCNKMYSESENTDTSCYHHVAPPIFHDRIKGWQCCKDKKAYDWEEFQSIVGCTVGKHSNIDPKIKFAASPTVAAATNTGNTSPPPPPQLKSINEFNKNNPDAATAASSAAKILSQPRKSSRNDDGVTARCQRHGCIYGASNPNGQGFIINDNHASACTYHKGKPIFHDANKYWSCCPNKKCYDFDSFMQVPGCTQGYHDDGVINLNE